MKNLLFAGLLMLSSSALMASSPLELVAQSDQFHFLQGIGEVAPAINIEAYERELNYLKQGLTIDEKVRNEANILAESIRTQVINAYEVELEASGNVSLAIESVKAMVNKDLELADKDMKEDLLKIAEHALLTISAAPRSESLDLSRLESILKEDIQNREAYLMAASQMQLSAMKGNKSGTKEISFQNFSSKQALVNALVTKEQNSRWMRTSNANFKAGQVTTQSAALSMQVKIEFLGVSVEAGPRISFKREYSTSVNILADGLEPVIDSSGRFDFFEKDNRGRSTRQRRFIAFYCDASLNFKTDYEGKGGFKVAGIGGEGSVSREYSNQVTMSSRRLYVPESVGNKYTNLNYLAEICHNDFLRAKINSRTTVRGSLDLMMKNVINGIRFSHPETQCAIDSHCNQWFHKEVIPLARVKATPRCVKNNFGNYSCVLRGTRGQSCSIIENGKRTSGGLGEYVCNTGLRCVKTRNAGWLQGGRIYQPSKGYCK